MLLRNIVFVLILLIVFTGFIALIPAAFLPSDINSSTVQADSNEPFNANNLIVYTNTASDNMSRGYDSLKDAPDPPQWPAGTAEGEFLAVNWINGPPLAGLITIYHENTNWLGGHEIIDILSWYYSDGTPVPQVYGGTALGVDKANLESAWNEETNSSVFSVKCSHINVNIVFRPNGTYTDIGESYDADELSYYITWEWNQNATGFSIMTLIARVLTFQSISLGIPGNWGTFISSIFSTFVWLIIIYCAYRIIIAVIPFIPGLQQD
jgi:hypothetical protein